MTERPPAEPLPHWMSHCDCPGKPRRHQPDCYRITAFNAYRMAQPFVNGKRYETYSIDFPAEIHVRADARIDFDPVGWFRQRLDDYVEWSDTDNMHWEKPAAYLIFCLDDTVDVDLPGWSDRTTVQPWGATLDVDVRWNHREWSEEHTVALHRALGLNDAGDARL